MSAQHKIEKITDLLALTPDEFRRMLPDLCTWYAFAKPLHGMPGITHLGFEWVDDGQEGNLLSVRAIDPITGEVTEIG